MNLLINQKFFLKNIIYLHSYEFIKHYYLQSMKVRFIYFFKLHIYVNF